MPVVSRQSRQAAVDMKALLAERPDGLFNDRASTMEIIHEKPEHRMCIILKVQGYSNTEIAKMLGYDNATVSQVLRQPWARKRILDMLDEAGHDPVAALVKSAAADSVATLIEIRDNPMAENAARVSASKELLDRYLGKPLQRVESRNETLHVSIKDIDSELEKLEAQEAVLLGRAVHTPAG